MAGSEHLALLLCSTAVCSVRAQRGHRGVRENTNRALIVTGLGWPPLTAPPRGARDRQTEKLINGVLQICHSFHVTWADSHGGGKCARFAVCGYSCLSKSIQVCTVKPFVMCPKEQQFLWHGSWQLKQVSKLVDRTARWLMTVSYWHLLTGDKGPPTVYISTKWITDTSSSNLCSTDLTSLLSPHSSQQNPVCLCDTAGPMANQALLKTWSIKTSIRLRRLSGRNVIKNILICSRYCCYPSK